MRGLCNGPATSLSILLPIPGILAPAPTLVVDALSVDVEPVSIEPIDAIGS
ncbi:MAG: hypothetical protein QM736_09485 [Vicinamibacterales bacterium]